MGGSYRTPEHRRDAVEEILTLLRDADRVVLTTHMNADGDGTGCEAALAAWLRAGGAEAFIVNPTPFPEMFRFLIPDRSWIVSAASADAEEVCAAADLAVVLDTGEVSRLGRVKPLLDPRPKVVIDHHEPGDAPIPGTDLRDASACATGELLYDVLSAAGEALAEPVLRGIYVAILTDTGSFRFSNATPACHRLVADLIEQGVDPEVLHRKVYGASPLRRLRLLHLALGTLETDPEKRVAWMSIPREAFEQLRAEPDDLEGIVDYPRSVEGVEVGLLFRETAEGGVKVSFRSTGEVDVNELARQFGGGGHRKASGALVTGRRLEDVREEVVDAAIRAVEETAPDGGSGGAGGRIVRDRTARDRAEE